MNRAEDETIVAIATATGGGIGVVRLSGAASVAVGRALVSTLPAELESHRMYHGWAHHPSTGDSLDEVLVVWMRAPRSYTGEEVVELHGHGGAASLARLLDAAIVAGARLAEPGEFTRRAFVRGKLDLARAEAVAELIAARSERAARVAEAHLRGGISDEVRAIEAGLIPLLAELEGRIDFPEEDLDFEPPASLARGLSSLRARVERFTASYARGRLLVEGIDVVLVGRANAGKSSLLNALAGRERALVDASPGTTRDFIEQDVDLDGIRATVVDTAGERDAVYEVERRGLELGRRRRAHADVVVVVIDGTVGAGELEQRLWQEAAPRRRLLVWNKLDQAPLPSEKELASTFSATVVGTSARSGAGVSDLRHALRGLLDADGDDSPATVTSARHKAALDDTARALSLAIGSLERDAPPELVAVDVRAALQRLRLVTGESVEADVIRAIFARFCLGK